MVLYASCVCHLKRWTLRSERRACLQLCAHPGWNRSVSVSKKQEGQSKLYFHELISMKKLCTEGFQRIGIGVAAKG